MGADKSVLGHLLRAARVKLIYWDCTDVWFLCQAAREWELPLASFEDRR
jgi:hypothetical protein